MDENEKEKKEPEEIKSYLESFGHLSEKEGVDNFLIYFSVGESGVVDVGMDWPEKNTDELISMTSTLLFSLNSGLLKNLMLDAITDSVSKYPELKDNLQKVVEKWLEIQNSSSDIPCIKPTDTLKNI